MATIASLVVNVAANHAQLTRDVQQVQKSLDGIGNTAMEVASTLGLAFSVGTVVAFAKEIGRFAGEMQDLADQTGINVRELQALNYAAAGAGTTIGQVADSISQMQKRIAEGDKGAVAALKEMGLSLDRIRGMNPDEAFIAIAEGIAAIKTPAEQTRVSWEIFGRSATQILALLKSDIRGVTDEAKRNGAVMSEELIKKADELDDMWSQLIIRSKALTVTVIDVGSKWLFFNNVLRAFADDITPRAIKQARELQREIEKQQKTLTPKGPALATNGFDPLARANETIAAFLKTIPAIEASKKKGEEWARQTQVMRERSDELSAALRLHLFMFGTALPAAIHDAAEEIRDLSKSIAGAGQNLEALNLLMDPSSTPIAIWDNEASKAVETTSAWDLALGDLNATMILFGDSLGGIAGDVLKFINIMQAGRAAGQNFAAAFKDKNLGGMVGAGAQAFATMEAATRFTGKGKNAASGALAGMSIGAFAGPVGMGVGAAAGALIGWLRAGSNERKEVEKLRASFIDAAGGIEELRRKALEAQVPLDALFAAKRLKDWERASASVLKGLQDFQNLTDMQNQMLDAQAQRQQLLNDAVERYGFTIEELGPKMQAQKLADQAEQLITDFTLLTESGIGVGTVVQKMGDSINEFIKTALKTGTEVPEAMRPMLEAMVNQGLLTDESGNKILDLQQSGLKFGETLTEMFKGVLQKLDDLILKLGTAIDQANKIPSNPFANWQIPAIDVPMPSNSGETPDGIPGFASGTRGLYPNFGSGTLVRLHGRERVMTEAEGRAGSASGAALVAEIRGLRSDMRELPDQLMAAAQIASGRGRSYR